MKTKLLIFCIAASVLFIGCEDPDEQSAPSIDSLGRDKIEAPVDGDSYQVTVKAVGEWNATVTDGQDASWVTITGSPGNGEGVFTVKVSPSGEQSSRTTSIDVKAGESVKQVSVSQDGITAALSLVDGDSANIDGAAQSVTVKLTANNTWKAEVVNAPADAWFSITSGTDTGNGNGEFVIEVLGNTSSESRSGTINVYLEEFPETNAVFTLTQGGVAMGDTSGYILVSPLDNMEEGFDVNTSGSWTVTCDADWIEVITVSGNGPGKAYIKTSANADMTAKRRAQLKITSSSGIETLTVCQPPLAVRITSDRVDLYWATLAVDEFRTFAAKPDERGRYYQFNRRIGYSSTLPTTPSFPSGLIDEPVGWQSENDPCPDGWRIPTIDEAMLIKVPLAFLIQVMPGEKGARHGGFFLGTDYGNAPDDPSLYDYPDNAVFFQNNEHINDMGLISPDPDKVKDGMRSEIWANTLSGTKGGAFAYAAISNSYGPQWNNGVSMKLFAYQIRCVKGVTE